jgi:hypothetical protein
MTKEEVYRTDGFVEMRILGSCVYSCLHRVFISNIVDSLLK